jgi:CBS domain-containing protein
MQLRDIMIDGFEIIEHDASVLRAAQMMRRLNASVLPVREGQRLVGTVTDHDITIRAIAVGASPETTLVADIMTRGVLSGYVDDDAETAAAAISEKPSRRLLVLDHSDRCVGIVPASHVATLDGGRARGFRTRLSA